MKAKEITFNNKKAWIGYNNKGFINRARHPHMDKELRFRVLLGYQPIEILGTCESCGKPIISLFEYETDEYGQMYCNDDCLEKALAE